MMPIARCVKSGFRFILVDFYGFGLSPHPDYPLTVRDYAQGVIEILNREGIEKADFVGHSFGGRVAIEIAYCYPDIVNKLVLCNSAGILPKRRLKYYTKLWFYKIRKRIGLDVSKCGSKEFRVLDPVMRKTFINVVNYDQEALLREIYADTFIVWGRKDKTTPIYMAKKFVRYMRNSTLIIYNNAGHFSYADELKDFSKKLKEFLSK